MMKPIEIHVEGYKIVISEDKDEGKPERKINIPGDDLTLPIAHPYTPPTVQPYDWWRYPYVTWTKDDSLSNLGTTGTTATPVRDFMVNGGSVWNSQEYKIDGGKTLEEAERIRKKIENG